jgi:hypothetical protein
MSARKIWKYTEETQKLMITQAFFKEYGALTRMRTDATPADRQQYKLALQSLENVMKNLGMNPDDFKSALRG